MGKKKYIKYIIKDLKSYINQYIYIKIVQLFYQDFFDQQICFKK